MWERERVRDIGWRDNKMEWEESFLSLTFRKDPPCTIYAPLVIPTKGVELVLIARPPLQEITSKRLTRVREIEIERWSLRRREIDCREFWGTTTYKLK